MTEQEFSKVMERLEDYYPKFYEGRDKKKTFKVWYPLFKDDSYEEVARACISLVCTLRFPPTVADIKQQLAEFRLESQPTPLEAFQTISNAVDHASDRTKATEAYNALTAVLRRLVGSPSQLISWRRLNDDTFQTVVMSAIRESYTTLAKREAKYYALPAGAQKAEQWRIEGKPVAELPAPEKTQSVDDMLDDMDRQAKEYREKYGVTLSASTIEKLGEWS